MAGSGKGAEPFVKAVYDIQAEASCWAASTVVDPKAGKSQRICGDYKVAVHRAERTRTGCFQDAFQACKQMHLESQALVHCEGTELLPCGALPYGVDAISHVGKDGEERPIALAPRTLK